MNKHKPLFYSFWSINATIEQKSLRLQMDQFQKAGLDGVVFHPRFYPDTPPYLGERYLKEVSDIILYAKSIGMRFWIYDENGWPSGTANGELLRKYPEDVCLRLDLVPGRVDGAVKVFQVSTDRHVVDESHRGADTWSLVVQKLNGVDCLSPKPSTHFLELVHENYRGGLAPEAFEYVEAFFADEPESGLSWAPAQQYAAVPWSLLMPQELLKIFGSDYLEKLPLLFFEGEGSGDCRRKFWELVAELFADGFFAPYLKWCQSHGKLFVGHVKGEEHPLFQIPMAGSCHHVFRSLGIPGIDALERFPSNHFFPRQAASVAWQFGDGRCMTECFGGSGWGAKPEDLERYLLWLGGHGLTDFVLHLGQYRLISNAIRDWPPSQPLHLNWRDAYPHVLKRVREKLAAAPSVGEADTLVVAPYRGIMEAYTPDELQQTNIHDAHVYPETEAGRINTRFITLINQYHRDGIAYHVTDEKTLEACAKREEKGLRLGNCLYSRVVVAEGARISPEVQGQIYPFVVKKIVTPTQVVRISEREDLASQKSIPVEWQGIKAASNSFLLEAVKKSTDAYEVSFEIESLDRVGEDVSLLFADGAREVLLNGQVVSLALDERGARVFPITPYLKKRNVIAVQVYSGVVDPYIWLEGSFAVRSGGLYAKSENGCLYTEGGFVVDGNQNPDPRALIESGYPFLRHPIVGEADIHVEAPVRKLHLGPLDADVARVLVDGVDAGWIWGPDWSVVLPQALTEGRHRLRLELIPSTYNFFGPHHYMAGDRKVISPDQFKGIRNFADPEDLPECTSIKGWHFKPLSFPSSVFLV